MSDTSAPRLTRLEENNMNKAWIPIAQKSLDENAEVVEIRERVMDEWFDAMVTPEERERHEQDELNEQDNRVESKTTH